MIPTPLSMVAEQCAGVLLDALHSAAESDVAGQSAADELVSTVVTDNRQVVAGSLFVAIKGERVDGNNYAGAALAAGAVGVLTDNPQAAQDSGAAPERIIAVSDSVTAMGNLAREQLVQVRQQGRPDFTVVAVTGSVGKTTTKDLLAALLAERGPIVAPPNSFNNPIGLPLTVLRADAHTATLVLEMGADHVGNIEYLTRIAPPDVAIVLIVARAHLGEFGGIDNVARAKSELVRGAREGAPVILNGDDVRVVAMSEYAHGPVLYFSTRGRTLEAGLKAAIYASDIQVSGSEHAAFTLHTPAGAAPVQLALVGEHHVANALAAAAAAYAVGISVDHIAQVLSTTGPVSAHRMAISSVRGATIIDDAYNANPDSMRAGIRALARLGRGKRTVAVLGKMNELGEHSAAEHRAIGRIVAEEGVQLLFTVGKDPDMQELRAEAELASAQAGGSLTTQMFSNVDEIIAELPTLIAPGDVVLLKGSNASLVWTIADALAERDSAARPAQEALGVEGE
ncbi:MAG: UDP-N-acetylmuramoyl-tripeptide--D-alanyl-D-alanine ligase [Arcanobacterium sp.]|nr:UDP-N-acetylmuramoyl-tripeptide--D-alanyl-D-alanine ligase [Arcanobacterium sp.]